MRIEFKFDLAKAIQVMAYIANSLNGVEKVKLTKLLYLADREHFLRAGYPITGDSQFAMKWGPVPSACLNVLDGETWPNPDAAFDFLHVDDNWVTVKRDTGVDRLTDAERQTLDAVIRQHGMKDKWVLVKETHTFPEYEATFKEGTSIRIPYETILQYHGSERQFRHGRPVITREMSEKMICPFTESEPLQ